VVQRKPDGAPSFCGCAENIGAMGVKTFVLLAFSPAGRASLHWTISFAFGKSPPLYKIGGSRFWAARVECRSEAKPRTSNMRLRIFAAIPLCPPLRYYVAEYLRCPK
jgi:hypothetical protein